PIVKASLIVGFSYAGIIGAASLMQTPWHLMPLSLLWLLHLGLCASVGSAIVLFPSVQFFLVCLYVVFGLIAIQERLRLIKNDRFTLSDMSAMQQDKRKRMVTMVARRQVMVTRLSQITRDLHEFVAIIKQTNHFFSRFLVCVFAIT